MVPTKPHRERRRFRLAVSYRANYDPRYVGAFPDLVNRRYCRTCCSRPRGRASASSSTPHAFPARYRNGGSRYPDRGNDGGVRNKVGSPDDCGARKIETSSQASGEDGSAHVDSAVGRSGGVTVSRDGALLVSDESGKRIWKISAARQSLVTTTARPGPRRFAVAYAVALRARTFGTFDRPLSIRCSAPRVGENAIAMRRRPGGMAVSLCLRFELLANPRALPSKPM